MKVEDSVAQLVEQYTFNVWVLGSSPSGITKRDKMKFFILSLLLFSKYLIARYFYISYFPL